MIPIYKRALHILLEVNCRLATSCMHACMTIFSFFLNFFLFFFLFSEELYNVVVDMSFSCATM